MDILEKADFLSGEIFVNCCLVFYIVYKVFQNSTLHIFKIRSTDGSAHVNKIMHVLKCLQDWGLELWVSKGKL